MTSPYKIPLPKINAVKPNVEEDLESIKNKFPGLFDDDYSNQN